MLDFAKLDASKEQCGQQVDKMLTIYTDEVAGNQLPRQVSFETVNAREGDSVEIDKKKDSDNDASWGNIRLTKAHAAEVTPRVPKGQLKKIQSKWMYSIVFSGGCTIDPGICIRTQSGGCTN